MKDFTQQLLDAANGNLENIAAQLQGAHIELGKLSFATSQEKQGVPSGGLWIELVAQLKEERQETLEVIEALKQIIDNR